MNACQLFFIEDIRQFSTICLANKLPHTTIQVLLVLHDFLSSEIALDALKKWYRINYGNRQNSHFKRSMLCKNFCSRQD